MLIQKKKDSSFVLLSQLLWMNYQTILSEISTSYCQCNHCKRVNNRFNKSYDLPLDLLQYRRENSAEYLYS